MLTAKRHAIIRQTVRELSSVSVSELAQKCDTSEVTIRRDLASLDREGIVTRVRGGAILADLAPDYLSTRFEQNRTYHYSEKQQIGNVAASLIETGDTIIIDSGSTCLELAKCLPINRMITVIATSIQLAEELEQLTGVNTILTGGTLRSRTTSLVDPMLSKSLQSVMASKVFLGVTGISTQHGLTTGDFAEADVKKTLISHAQEVIVLADFSKLNQVTPAFIAKLEQAHTLVTDDKADPEVVQVFQNAGLKIVIANSNHSAMKEINNG